MPVWQFQGHLNPNNTVNIPPEVAGQLQPSEPVRVVLVPGNADDDAEWKHLAAEQFLRGYAPSDDIFDQLPSG
jgi:hypothetical protein